MKHTDRADVKAATARAAKVIEMQGYAAFLRWIAANKARHEANINAR